MVPVACPRYDDARSEDPQLTFKQPCSSFSSACSLGEAYMLSMVVVSECVYIHIYMLSFAQKVPPRKEGLEATNVLSSLNQGSRF